MNDTIQQVKDEVNGILEGVHNAVAECEDLAQLQHVYEALVVCNDTINTYLRLRNPRTQLPYTVDEMINYLAG